MMEHTKKIIAISFLMFILLTNSVYGESLSNDGKLNLYTKAIEKKEETNQQQTNASVTDKANIPLFTEDFTETYEGKNSKNATADAIFRNNLFLTNQREYEPIEHQLKAIGVFTTAKSNNGSAISQETNFNIGLGGQLIAMVFLGGLFFLVFTLSRKAWKKGFKKGTRK